MITTPTSAEREAFESTMLRMKYFEQQDLERDQYGYEDEIASAAWLAWQARAAMQTGEAVGITYTVDGEVMTPFEYIDHLHDQLLITPDRAPSADHIPQELSALAPEVVPSADSAAGWMPIPPPPAIAALQPEGPP